jgi:hypothetical protein
MGQHKWLKTEVEKNNEKTKRLAYGDVSHGTVGSRKIWSQNAVDQLSSLLDTDDFLIHGFSEPTSGQLVIPAVIHTWVQTLTPPFTSLEAFQQITF